MYGGHDIFYFVSVEGVEMFISAEIILCWVLFFVFRGSFSH